MDCIRSSARYQPALSFGGKPFDGSSVRYFYVIKGKRLLEGKVDSGDGEKKNGNEF